MKEKIKKNIIKKINDTEKLIIQLKDLTKPIPPENAIGRVSRMDAINNKSINEVALKKAELLLKKLELSLKKTDDINFGKCYRCGTKIPEQRLILVPESNKCVQCA